MVTQSVPADDVDSQLAERCPTAILPLYTFLQNLGLSHNLKNPLCASLKQSIRPEFTGHTLLGPRKISYRSPGFYLIDDFFLAKFPDFDDIGTSSNFGYTLLHIGEMLSGHAQIVHGGLVATLLDELTCLLGFQNFPSKKAVTANLSINYIQPCFVDTYVMIKCTVMKKKGRKCWVKGQMFNLDLDAVAGNFSMQNLEDRVNLLSECECLVIEPRWVHQLQN